MSRIGARLECYFGTFRSPEVVVVAVMAGCIAAGIVTFGRGLERFSAVAATVFTALGVALATVAAMMLVCYLLGMLAHTLRQRSRR